MKILVTAMQEEMDAFGPVPEGWMKLVAGIGKTRMSSLLTEFLCGEEYISEVLLVGTAGGLTSNLKGMDLCKVIATLDPDVSFKEMGDYNIGENPFTLDGCLPLQENTSIFSPKINDTFKEAVALSSSKFCGKNDKALMLQSLTKDYNYDTYLVDMETYAAAWVCKRFNVPFTALRVITDDSSTDDSSGDFNENLKRSMRKLRENITF